MVHKVEIQNHQIPGIVLIHHFEQIVDDTEQASEFGEQCAYLMNAYQQGFGGATFDE